MNNTELMKRLNCDILNHEDSTLVEGIIEEMTRKEILENHKPPIKQLSNGCWYTRVNGHRIERKNKIDCEDALIKAYEENEMNIERLFDDFIIRRRNEVANTTIAKYYTYYDLYVKNSAILKKPLSKLRLRDGYDFLEHCLTIKPNMKKRYWNNVIGFLNQLFLFAMGEGYIETNPFENVRPKNDLFEPSTYTKETDTVFSKEERKKICEIAENEANKKNDALPLGIVLLFQLGLRIGELCALKWEDVLYDTQSQKNYLSIHREVVTHINENGKTDGYEVLSHCKTKAGTRKIELNTKAMQTLDEIARINKLNGYSTENEQYIFLRTRNKKITYCSSRTFDPRLRRYCKEAGMKTIKSAHDIRRTVITELFNANVPAKNIQAFAGHSTFEQTLKYVRAQETGYDMFSVLDVLST